MELKVWVEGIQRIVCNVTDSTTCQDVVFALAHATGKTGRFTLIERWRNNSRLLAPTESPLKILNKLGEYSGEVQFILQKSEKSIQIETNVGGGGENVEKRTLLEKSKAINDNVGIVKGIPQSYAESNDNSNNGFDIPAPTEILRTENNSSSDSINNPRGKLKNVVSSSSSSSSPVIGVSGSLNPPPYRNPPSSKQSHFQNNVSKVAESNNNINNNHNINNNNNNNNSSSSSSSNNADVSKSNVQSNDDIFHSIQYKDLLHLIKLQREKIINQQNDLTKFDAEIVYLESKSREQIQQFEMITQELTKTDHAFRQGNEQLQTMQYIEDESELAHQQEKTLKAEIALLRSKLGILETELLQCKNKIKKLMNDVHLEQRSFSQKQENQNYLEKKLISEVDRLQADIDYVMNSSDSTLKSTETLKKEIGMIEMSIVEKKKQLEKLVHEMKEVNLQSLTVTTDDHHLLFDGSSKRRMIGSPRQLVNAPAHGVWV